jgi:outer membrane protein assembly factor BamB
MVKKLDLPFRGVNLICGLFLLLVATSCGPSPSSVAPSNAPPYGMVLGNARRALYENEIIPTEPVVEWDINAGSGMRGTLLLLDSTILTATTNRQMLAFHRRTGRKHWDQRFNNGVTTTALYDRNRVYVATDEYDGSLFALNTERGRKAWKRTVGPVRFTPLLNNDVVFLGTDAGVVTALSTDGGAPLWRVGLGGPIAESPLDVGDGIVVFTTSDSVFTLRKADGAVTARAMTRSTPSASPAIAGATIVVPMQDSSIVGLNVRTLAEVWRLKASSPVLTTPVVTSTGDVYAASRDGMLYRIRDGRYENVGDVGHAISPSMTLVREHLILGSYDGTLIAMSMNGQVVWKHKFNDSVVAPVAVGDQAIYVPLLRGRIVKLRNND